MKCLDLKGKVSLQTSNPFEVWVNFQKIVLLGIINDQIGTEKSRRTPTLLYSEFVHAYKVKYSREAKRHKFKSGILIDVIILHTHPASKGMKRIITS